jgi:hypothetical protein
MKNPNLLSRQRQASLDNAPDFKRARCSYTVLHA